MLVRSIPCAKSSILCDLAIRKSTPKGVLFLINRQVYSNPSAEGAGNACERVRWTIQRAGVGVAVEKIQE